MMLVEIETTKDGKTTKQILDIPVDDIKIDGVSLNESGTLRFNGKPVVIVTVNKEEKRN